MLLNPQQAHETHERNSVTAAGVRITLNLPQPKDALDLKTKWDFALR